MTNGSLQMPITAEPYQHQEKAFVFVCRLFGILDGEEAGDDNKLRNVWKTDKQETEQNQKEHQ